MFVPGQYRQVWSCWTAHHQFIILTNSWLWPQHQLDWTVRNTKSIHVAHTQKKIHIHTANTRWNRLHAMSSIHETYITGCFNRHLNISKVTPIRGALWSIKLTNVTSSRVWNRTPQISDIPNSSTYAHPSTTKIGVSNWWSVLFSLIVNKQESKTTTEMFNWIKSYNRLSNS